MHFQRPRRRADPFPDPPRARPRSQESVSSEWTNPSLSQSAFAFWGEERLEWVQRRGGDASRWRPAQRADERDGRSAPTLSRAATQRKEDPARCDSDGSITSRKSGSVPRLSSTAQQPAKNSHVTKQAAAINPLPGPLGAALAPIGPGRENPRAERRVSRLCHCAVTCYYKRVRSLCFSPPPPAVRPSETCGSQT